MPYEPTKASLASHPLPGWFDDAKFGIFIHWTPASVPGWAPVSGELTDLVKERGFEYWLANNPYTEWYVNTLRIPGSPVEKYHRETYGADFPYDAFIPMFRQANEAWNPEAWAETFAAAGARYVVLVTKHHDGYLLWPSWHPNPHKQHYQSERDLVGELTEAVRARGMKMGLYYSGGLDWTFEDHPITSITDMIQAIPTRPEYAAYVDAHYRELIERYEPSVLWNDIGYPAGANLMRLFADYYNATPDGVVNDRFGQFNLGRPGSVRYRLTRWTINHLLPLLMKIGGGLGSPTGGHADFRTPEYASPKKAIERKWESCRGMGYSFGYNRQERDEHMIAPDALVRSFVDMVSKNGNLLLNVGPMPDGTIPELQLKRLRAMGAWLKANGEAIYGTRPWTWPEGKTADGLDVRFTQRDGTLYATLLGAPAARKVTIRDLQPQPGSRITLLEGERPVTCAQEGADLAIVLPEPLPVGPAFSLRIAP
jgi:alpha-L-fucosidase